MGEHIYLPCWDLSFEHQWLSTSLGFYIPVALLQVLSRVRDVHGFLCNDCIHSQAHGGTTNPAPHKAPP
jgi:hypothetical protein